MSMQVSQGLHKNNFPCMSTSTRNYLSTIYKSVAIFSDENPVLVMKGWKNQMVHTKQFLSGVVANVSVTELWENKSFMSVAVHWKSDGNW